MPPGESSVTVYRWPFPSANKLQSFSLWQIGSAIVIPAVGILSKIMAGWLNTVKVHNREVLIDALDNRPAGTPLITVSNHHSCLDDPMLWGILDWRHIFNSRVMRWTAAAHDICFTNDWHAQFFALGKTFPVVRGDGVYQKAMDFCLERLNSGAWVHFFPEGKVNMAKNEFIRLKWGIGRLIAECKICPIVIPFWHLGMDSVLPNVEPYMPRIGQTVTILFGKPVDFSALREKLWSEMKTAKHFSGYATDPHWHGITICVNAGMSSYPCTCQAMGLSTFERDYSVTLPRNQMEQRKIITDKLQDELFQLKSQAEILHFGGSG